MHRSNEQTIDRRLDEAGSTGCRQPCCGSGDTGMRKGHAATAIRDSHRGADRGAEGLARADLEIEIGRLVRKGGLSESCQTATCGVAEFGKSEFGDILRHGLTPNRVTNWVTPKRAKIRQ